MYFSLLHSVIEQKNDLAVSFSISQQMTLQPAVDVWCHQTGKFLMPSANKEAQDTIATHFIQLFHHSWDCDCLHETLEENSCYNIFALVMCEMLTIFDLIWLFFIQLFNFSWKLSPAPIFSDIKNKAGVTNSTVYAVYDYDATLSDELSFKNGDKLTVICGNDSLETEWWRCRLESSDANEGYVPRNYLAVGCCCFVCDCAWVLVRAFCWLFLIISSGLYSW